LQQKSQDGTPRPRALCFAFWIGACWSLQRRKPGITYGEQHTARPLLTPDEVRNLPQNLELLFLAGQRPIVAGKLAYYADSEFRGLFDQA
jgi:type IV secretion system protein VirD4